MSATHLLDLSTDAIGTIFAKIGDKESRKAFMSTCRSIHQNQACLSQLHTLRLVIPRISPGYEACLARLKDVEENDFPLPDDCEVPSQDPSFEECAESVRQQLETVPRGAAIHSLLIKGSNLGLKHGKGLRAISAALSSNQGPRQSQLQHQITFLQTIASHKENRFKPVEALTEPIEAMLDHLPNLTSLKLKGHFLDSRLLQSLQTRGLEHLSIDVGVQCWWPEDYSALASLTGLSSLDLSVIDHSDVMDLSVLAPHTGLTSLQLRGQWVSGFTRHSLKGQPRSETSLPSGCGGTDQYCGAPALLAACKKLRSAHFDMLPLDMSSMGSIQHLTLNTASSAELSAIVPLSAGLQLHVNHLRLRTSDGAQLVGTLQALKHLPFFTCGVLWLESSRPGYYDPCASMMALLPQVLPLLPAFDAVVLRNLLFAASELSGLCAQLETSNSIRSLHLLCCSLVPESLTEVVCSLPALKKLDISTGKYGPLELPDFLPSSLLSACAMSPSLEARLFMNTTGQEEYDATRFRGGTKGPARGSVKELRKSGRMGMVVWGRDGLHMGMSADLKTHMMVGD